MQCVILAGGLGTRLAPHSQSAPKALISVAGRTFADLQLSWLASEGVTRVLYCVGHLGEQVEKYVAAGKGWGLHVSYSHEGSTLRGTAGALRLALDSDLLEDEFFVLYGDSYLSVNLADVERVFRESGLPMLMTVFHNEGQWVPSNVMFQNGRVTRYCKVPTSTSGQLQWIDSGICIMERGVVRRLVPPNQVYDLAPVFAELATLAQITGYEVHERFYEVGSPAGLSDLERMLLGRTPRSEPSF